MITNKFKEQYMAKYKPSSQEQGVMIPIDFTQQIQEGTLECTINWLVDNRVDLEQFNNKYKNNETGAPAYDPRVLLKITLFAYSRGIKTSRRIARSCLENIIFMALSGNSTPDFTTIAWFIRSMKSEILAVFQNILLVCSEMDLLSGTEFAIDGCKMSSNASKEWSGTFHDLEKKKNKIEKVIKHLINKHATEDSDDDDDQLSHKKRIQRMKKNADKIEKFLSSHEPKKKSRHGEGQSNITDNESAKMKTSHGVIQGYNGLALVDSKRQVVVHAEAFGSGHEHALLKPMIEGGKQTFEKIGLGKNYFENKRLIADTGSFKEENLMYLANEKMDAYIPDQQFRKRDPRFKDMKRHRPAGRGLFTKEDFTYNSKNNCFICPASKILKYTRYQHFNNTEGRVYISKRSQCQSCHLREKCLTSDKTRYRTLYVIEKYFNRNYSVEMKNKIDTEEGRKIYSRRMGIVEPVFGNIRACKNLDRFTLRTKTRVNIQWLLYVIVHNIEKIAKYGQIQTA